MQHTKKAPHGAEFELSGAAHGGRGASSSPTRSAPASPSWPARTPNRWSLQTLANVHMPGQWALPLKTRRADPSSRRHPSLGRPKVCALSPPTAAHRGTGKRSGGSSVQKDAPGPARRAGQLTAPTRGSQGAAAMAGMLPSVVSAMQPGGSCRVARVENADAGLSLPLQSSPRSAA
jgi:hypothetical protein